MTDVVVKNSDTTVSPMWDVPATTSPHRSRSVLEMHSKDSDYALLDTENNIENVV
jgi:hypothetical protein